MLTKHTVDGEVFEVYALKDGSFTIGKGAWLILRVFPDGLKNVIMWDCPNEWLNKAYTLAARLIAK